MNVCQICGEGHLFDVKEKSIVNYFGKTNEVDHEYSICDTCGVTQVNPEQSRRNKQAMVKCREQSVHFRIPHERFREFMKERKENPTSERLGQAFYRFMEMHKQTQDRDFCDRLFNADDAEASLMIETILEG